jgi:hypothetical protein
MAVREVARRGTTLGRTRGRDVFIALGTKDLKGLAERAGFEPALGI